MLIQPHIAKVIRTAANCPSRSDSTSRMIPWVFKCSTASEILNWGNLLIQAAISAIISKSLPGVSMGHWLSWMIDLPNASGELLKILCSR